jgi:xylan 1,4-beta-xylosidase
VQVLLWDPANPTDGKMSDQDYFFHEQIPPARGKVVIKLENLKPGNYRLAVSRIGFHFNDPYSRYLELGRPTDLSRAAVAELNKLSSGQPVSESQVKVSARGCFETTVPLCQNDVYLLLLRRD